MSTKRIHIHTHTHGKGINDVDVDVAGTCYKRMMEMLWHLVPTMKVNVNVELTNKLVRNESKRKKNRIHTNRFAVLNFGLTTCSTKCKEFAK